ncbi:MAG: four helix bundle protein [Candidatus Saganbacteria bacterium]|nr:four helix bundle protein [Candidatus Saganbacteria bacterium]
MDIQDRALEFGVRTVKFADKLPKSQAGSVIIKQLIRSGTSIGANMEEADGASSKKDFINKVIISRKEARETRYWLRLIDKAELIHGESSKLELEKLTKEVYELMKILSSIVNKAREKSGYSDV